MPDEPLVEDVEIWLGPLKAQIIRAPRPDQAVTAVLTIGGLLMSDVTISIDDTTGAAKLTWVDDHGDTDAPAPEGYVSDFQSDNPAVLTVDPATGAITPVAEGVASVSAPIHDAAGNPIPLPSGQGVFSAGSVSVTVGPGLAVSVTESVTP